jgi:uncharacterized protein YyaL (SSP411 family)
MCMSDSQTHDAALLNEDGSPKYTNALTRESSPYLLQHAHNPVDWYPWGAEAFELARTSGRSIFLSVGYSTCYWCHVMERQVFENPRIAAQMNRDFVNIKVDREERPDVDDIYMTAVQLMTRRGGWPMSVFLTAPGEERSEDRGLEPFYAGTYFPPAPTGGMPGFPQVLESVHDAWQNRRSAVREQASQLTEAVRQHLGQRDEPATPGLSLVQEATNQLLGMYEQQHGGFGGAPKFPQPSNLLFLLRVYRNNPNEQLWQALSHTLERMARGGMYDQIGGGFHRYSTDEKWLVPHFEKMLYDNGQLVEAYLEAHSIRPHEKDPDLYARVAGEVCDYVLREMVDETGAFYSAQDAEVDAREGGSYVWTPDEVRQAVNDEAVANLALKMYGLDQGTNFQDPHHPQVPATNVLYLPQRLDELAAQAGLALEEVAETRRRIDRLLLAARDTRKQPSTDDKVLASWNGLMIGALARAGRDLGAPRYTEAAAGAAQAILKHMTNTGGGLARSMRAGRAKIAGFLEDHACFGHGLIELYRSMRSPRWLDEARRITREAGQRFSADAEHGGGCFDTLEGQDDLFVRVRSTNDGAMPSGNSQMVHNLVDLYELTSDEAYLDAACKDLGSFTAAMKRQGAGMVHMHHALLRGIESAPGRFTEDSAPPTSHAARPKNLSIQVEPDRVEISEGSAELRVTLRIPHGHHINAHAPGHEGLFATQLILEGTSDVALDVRYPDGRAVTYSYADGPVNVYEGTVQIEATIRATGPNSTAAPRLVLVSQMCTDGACLEPQRVEVPVQFADAKT